MQNPAIGYVPISLTSICSLPCIPSADATLNKFLLPKEAFAVAAFGNGFYFTEKLFLTLLVHSDSASTFFQSVETVAEELLA